MRSSGSFQLADRRGFDIVAKSKPEREACSGVKESGEPERLRVVGNVQGHQTGESGWGRHTARQQILRFDWLADREEHHGRKHAHRGTDQ